VPPDPRPIAIHLPSLGREGLTGGAERVAVTLATEFIRAGRATDLVLSVVRPQPLEGLLNEVRIIDLASPRLWTALPSLIAYRWRERPHMVLSMMPLANVMNVMSASLGPAGSRTAVISEVSIRSIALDSDFDLEGTRLLHPLCRVAYPRAAAIIACSEGVADRVREVHPRAAHGTVAIPNPVDPAVEPRDDRPVHPWLDDPEVPCIVAIGRLHPSKDHLTLLRTIERIRQRRAVRALLIGEGPLRAELEDEIDRLGLADTVQMLGYVSSPRKYLAGAALLLHTSRWEGFGLVLVEALAEGVPVVASDCETGPRDILSDGRYGRLAPVGDVAALADAVDATLDARPNPAQLRARAADFAPSEIARRYLEVIDSVAS
jgi:glycosyltransferase involved in cell wall biosynthesis